jgi:2-polyprenyl-6-methoxyphenol hydroxylase-like FAD-dependent oxidoreductase
MYEKLAVSNSRGQELGNLFHRSEKHYNNAALRVHRAKVQVALFEKAKAQGVEVHFGMKLTDLREGDISVELAFANGDRRSRFCRRRRWRLFESTPRFVKANSTTADSRASSA